ncbi:hypothetical protein BegalDRAFT_2712 [Beggiatoa alba B18LD]|uniref:DUF2066 domain-containing protein n=1 Tax=Beggiatoa alba B18LD TaxID=395493 RepID=I3CIW0_9GAMM|nr:DUF2066 domain-containing protein [Beggiatoa alba]EIJ43553.1 hypothetical protein BegalDRAFT_2712 [Beggiatoa alba B18LD]
MIWHRTLFLISWLFLSVLPVYAEQTLYEATVPIASRDENLLEDGFARAFAQVMANVSSEQATTDPEKLKKLSAKAKSLVAQYEYREKSDKQLMLVVGFEPQGTKRALRNASINVPRTNPNRTPLLTWIVLEEDTNSRIINEEEGSEAVTILKQQATQRGIPLLFPVLDIDDHIALPLTAVKNAEASSATSVASRYGAETMLVGWISKQPSMWQGQWVVYAKGAVIKNWKNQETALPLLLQRTINEAITEISKVPATPVVISTPTTNNAPTPANPPSTPPSQSTNTPAFTSNPAFTGNPALSNPPSSSGSTFSSKIPPEMATTQNNLGLNNNSASSLPPTNTAVEETVELQITAVDNWQDYVTVNNYLKNIESLRNLQIQHREQGQITFKVTIKGGSSALNQLFATDGVLTMNPQGHNANTYQLVK